MKKQCNIILFIIVILFCATNINAQSLSGSGTAADPYLIESADDWNTFANDVNGGYDYSGKTVKLTRYISVTTMVGGDMTGTPLPENPNRFSGTFDGGGNTLLVTYETEQCVAPFRYISGATIKNLTVDGTLSANRTTAGFVYDTNGDSKLIDCLCKATINTNNNADATNGGMAVIVTGGTLTFTNCVFNGKILGATPASGGFVGWNNGSNITYNNCLFAPKELTTNISGCNTFNRNGKCTLNGAYYTQTLGSAQGVKAVTAIPFNNITTKRTTILDMDFYPLCEVSGVEDTYFYSGTPITVDYTVKLDGITLPEGSVTAKITNSENIVVENISLSGEYTITISPAEGSDYLGSWSKTFEVIRLLSPDGDGNYTISSTDEWNAFALMVNSDNTFSGKTVKLLDDISVTTMVGSSEKRFKGTFEGNGKTLDIALSASADNCAPFLYLENAVIQNLTVTGTISTSKKFGAGIAAHTYGTTSISNCLSKVSISSTVNGDGTHGGFVAVNESGTLTIENCVFNGKLLGSSATSNGGIVGWNAGSNITYNNCLFIPEQVTMSTSSSCTFNRNEKCTLNGAYYTQTFGTAQGTKVNTAATTNKINKVYTILDYTCYRLCDVSGVENSYLYDGSTSVSVNYSVKIDNTALPAGSVTAEITDSENNTVEEITSPGEYTITISGVEENGYEGSWSKTFEVELSLDGDQDNSNLIATMANNEKSYNVKINNYTLYSNNEWNTICLPFDITDFTGTIFENATVKAESSYSLDNDRLTINYETVTSINAGKPYIVKWAPGTTDKNGRFVIRNVEDWNTFIEKVDGGQKNLNAVLANDIEGVTTMVTEMYMGTFDGNGHTITVNLISETDNTKNFTALFRKIGLATIKNLKVDGKIKLNFYSDYTARYASGIVGEANGTNHITNCISNVKIETGSNSRGLRGGLVGYNKGDLYLTDCVFSGEMLKYTSSSCGGFVHSNENDTRPVYITRCLFAPAGIENGTSGNTFNGGGNLTLDHAYYTQALGTEQGTLTDATGDDLAALLGTNWEGYGDIAVPKLTTNPIEYTNIENPKFEGVSVKGDRWPVQILFQKPNGLIDVIEIAGSYAPLENDVLVDVHNTDKKAFHAALKNVGGDCYLDAERQELATTIPFEDDGTTTLYFASDKHQISVAQSISHGVVTINKEEAYPDEIIVLTLTPDAFYRVHSVSYNDGSTTNLITPQDGNYSFVMPSVNVTVSATFEESLERDEAGNYLIASTEDWNIFAGIVNTGNTFSGKTVKLINDISVTTMVGYGDESPNGDNKSNFKYFAGTFDGGDNTLDINITGIGVTVAPFRYVDGATFNNVRVTGTINAGLYQRAASIAGWFWGNGTLNNCHSDVTINSSINGNGSHGGLVGASDVDGNILRLNNCVFSGTLNAPNATNNGGLLGWCYSNGNKRQVYMKNCLMSGKLECGTSSTGYFYQEAQNTQINLEDCYYIEYKGNAQGTHVYQAQSEDFLATKLTLADGNDYYLKGETSISNIEIDENNQITYTVKFNDETLTENTDYTATVTSYADMCAFLIRGQGDYYGSVAMTITKTPYAFLEDDGKTLTFKIDYKPDEAYDIDKWTTKKINNKNVDVMDWYSNNGSITEVVFDDTFKDARPTSFYNWFYGLTNLIKITGIENLNTSEVTSMRGMFDKCKNLECIDLSHFNTDNLTNIRAMFCDCEKLTTLDLSSFNTLKVTESQYMFQNCKKLTTILIDDSKWSLSKVTNHTGMFENCSEIIGNDGTKLGSVINKTKAHAEEGGYLTKDDYKIFYKWADEDGFKTQYTPSSYNSSTTPFTIDNPDDRVGHPFLYWTQVSASGEQIGESSESLTIAADEVGNRIYVMHWAGTYVEYSEDGDEKILTFKCGETIPAGAYQLNSGETTPTWSSKKGTITKVVFDESFKDARPTSCYQWFNEFENLETITDIKYLNTENVTNMKNMFYKCKKISSLDLRTFNTGSVTSMRNMFNECKLLTSLDVSSFNTENVTDMGYMFKRTAVSTINLSGFNTAKVTTMEQMFNECRQLISLDLSSFDTKNVTTMYFMISVCDLLEDVDVSSFNTENVKNMQYMFWKCPKLTSVNVSGFNTDKVEEMGGMFGYCNFNVLDLRSFNTSSVQNTTSMFKENYNLTTILIGDDWDISTTTESTDMFLNCPVLVGNDGTKVGEIIDKTYAHAYAGGYLTKDSYKIYLDINASDATMDCATCATNSNNYIYTEYSNDFTLPIPTRDGYTFEGWKRVLESNGKLEKENTETVSKNAGNRWFKAQWELIPMYSVVAPENYTASPTKDYAGENITITYSGSKPIGSIKLVPLPTSIVISPSKLYLAADATETVTAAIYPDLTEVNKNVTWTSSNTSVATVTETTDLQTTITTHAHGTAVITATTEKNNKTASVFVVCADENSSYYIDPIYGHDDNNGLTAETAFKSFSKLLEQINDADKDYVVVLTGEWTNALNLSSYTAKSLTISGAGGGTDYLNTTVATSDNSITFENIKVKQLNGGAVLGDGAVVENVATSSNLIVRGSARAGNVTLHDDAKIVIAGKLSAETVAVITPSNYSNQVIELAAGVTDTDIARECGKFTVTPDGTDNYYVQEDGKLGIVP